MSEDPTYEQIRAELKKRNRLVQAILDNMRDSILIIEDQLDLPLGPGVVDEEAEPKLKKGT